MRTLVCGDRHLDDQAFVDIVLNSYSITVVIEGEARGADTLARTWAESHGIPVEKYPADWARYGRAAGPIRNKQMLVEGKPDLVIAFLAKGSKGTKNMIEQAKQAKVPVNIIPV